MGKGGSASAKGVDQLNGSASWAARAIKPAEKLEAREDFIWDTTDEPHASRRKEIMKAHPEVKQLFGHEWRSKYLCTFLLIIPQIFLSVYTVDFSWPTYLFVAYVFGATITQALFLAIHELAHNLFFQSTQANRLFAMVANWPIGIPYCVPFRGYHLEHHKWQVTRTPYPNPNRNPNPNTSNPNPNPDPDPSNPNPNPDQGVDGIDTDIPSRAEVRVRVS